MSLVLIKELLVYAEIVYNSKMTFKKTTHKKLTLITLISLVAIAAFSVSSEGYADIGYRDGLLIESFVNIESVLYLKAAKGLALESVGVGIGFTEKSYSVVLSSNYLDEEVEDFNVDVSVSYYDIGKVSYFANINRSGLGKTGYKIGVGYSINERVSLVVNYSDKGVFFGIRRWL